jgi:histidine triad (HIT) family protein
MAADCLFCRIASGAMEVPKLHEDGGVGGDAGVFAIRDINPRAPTHVLVIPKQHIADARALTANHGATLARMFEVARTVADAEGVRDSGYRIAFNVGDDAGMTIHHLHMHVIGGRTLGPEG